MIYLLDVNVLIALMDRSHIHHEPAHGWFGGLERDRWATCPMTENAAVRIMGSPSYANSPGSLVVVARLLQRMMALPGHVFWADDVSLFGSPDVDVDRILAPAQITDSYLLALASAHGGKLASFDRRLITDPVRNGSTALRLIG
ncbi:MAG: TA system VapC family ribonuclease toxin [Acidobacteriaceae bacterium]